MNLSTPEIVAIAVAVVVVLAIIAFAVVAFRKRKHHRDQLKQRYGAEYDRTVDRAGSRRKADEQLNDRDARREQLEIGPLSSAQRSGFRGRFEDIAASFVDSPESAVRSADALLDEVAEARGYPPATAQQRLEDLAVDHPAAVERYRDTRARPTREGGGVSTEQQRQALLGSRALLESLVGRDAGRAADAPPSFGEVLRGDGSREHSNGNGHRRHEPSTR